jgi:hypothetical protein
VRHHAAVPVEAPWMTPVSPFQMMGEACSKPVFIITWIALPTV